MKNSDYKEIVAKAKERIKKNDSEDDLLTYIFNTGIKTERNKKTDNIKKVIIDFDLDLDCLLKELFKDYNKKVYYGVVYFISKLQNQKKYYDFRLKELKDENLPEEEIFNELIKCFAYPRINNERDKYLLEKMGISDLYDGWDEILGSEFDKREGYRFESIHTYNFGRMLMCKLEYLIGKRNVSEVMRILEENNIVYKFKSTYKNKFGYSGNCYYLKHDYKTQSYKIKIPVSETIKGKKYEYGKFVSELIERKDYETFMYSEENESLRITAESIFKLRLDKDFKKKYQKNPDELIIKEFYDNPKYDRGYNYYSKKSYDDRQKIKKYKKLISKQRLEDITYDQWCVEFYTGKDFIEEFKNNIDKFIKYEETHYLERYKFISTCKAHRIYSPFSGLPTPVRKFVRLNGKQLMEIDARHSIPSIFAMIAYKDFNITTDLYKNIIEGKDVYDALGFENRNDAKRYLNSAINSPRDNEKYQKICEKTPEFDEVQQKIRELDYITDEIRDYNERWLTYEEACNNSNKVKKPDNYRKYNIVSFIDHKGLLCDTLTIARLKKGKIDKYFTGMKNSSGVIVNHPRNLHKCSYYYLFNRESIIMQNTLLNIYEKLNELCRTKEAKNCDVILLHDGLYVTEDNYATAFNIFNRMWQFYIMADKDIFVKKQKTIKDLFNEAKF